MAKHVFTCLLQTYLSIHPSIHPCIVATQARKFKNLRVLFGTDYRSEEKGGPQRKVMTVLRSDIHLQSWTLGKSAEYKQSEWWSKREAGFRNRMRDSGSLAEFRVDMLVLVVKRSEPGNWSRGLWAVSPSNSSSHTHQGEDRGFERLYILQLTCDLEFLKCCEGQWTTSLSCCHHNPTSDKLKNMGPVWTFHVLLVSVQKHAFKVNWEL